jgi:PAS domain S-box-containing protein
MLQLATISFASISIMPHTLIPNTINASDNAERFALVVEAVSAGIWDWDIFSNEEWWSARFYELIGYAPGEIPSTYETWLEHILHPDDKKAVLDAVHRHLATQAPYRIEIRQKHKTLGYRWFETHGIARFDVDGKPLRMVGSTIDIHSKKEGQILQEKYEFMLEEMSSMANVGAWEYLKNAPHPFWSQQIYRIYELPLDYDLSLYNSQDYIHPDHYLKIREALIKGMADGTPYDLDFQLTTKQNNVKWIRTIGKPFHKEDGSIIGMRGVIQDITEAKKMELERLQTIKLLSNHNSRLQNFAHIVSHNLRSHATNLEMLINFLDKETDPDQISQLIQMLKTTSGLLSETLDNLSEVVKIQSVANPKKTVIDLKSIYDRTLLILSTQIESSGTKITADFSCFSKVEFDYVYGESIMLNLLSNAIKYRKANEKSSIFVYTHIKEGRFCLSVQDNGLGLDLEQVNDRLFGMYKTFHGNEDARGLGLFLTKNQLESLGGSLEVTSVKGEGSTFTAIF